METVFEIATQVSTPLALGGLFASILFFTLRQLIKKDTFPALTRSASADVIKIIIDRLFVLALVAMVLGFAGYIIPKPGNHLDNVPSQSYEKHLEDIYSYKKAIGPPPNVGLMTKGIIGLRDYPSNKEHALIVLEELRKDTYLNNPIFSKQYKQIIKVIDETEKFIKQH